MTQTPKFHILYSFTLIQPKSQDENSGNISYVHSIYRNSTIIFSKDKKKKKKRMIHTEMGTLYTIPLNTIHFRVSMEEEIGIRRPSGQSQFLNASYLMIHFICAQNNK